ncbi:MAG TPA: phospholipase D-like domain-containing protein [Vicinamibacteria bacterium]|nr:phospholipase D-like domain-containing protein [Vicinamibacteria bacterium]
MAWGWSRGRGPAARGVACLLASGLALGGCARLPPRLLVPDLAVASAGFAPTVEAYTEAPARSGNRVDLLLNGDQIFPAQARAIRAARKTITYAQYLYEDGPPARRIVDALSERCRRGVRGHVLLDGFGSMNMPAEYREELEAAGCEVAVFHSLNPLRLDTLNRRNHRRILVVDGRVGFTGGSGASSRWLGDGRRPGYWRQTDVRVEGPVVNDLQAAFAESWLQATGEMLGGPDYFGRPPAAGPVVAQVVRSSPTGGASAAYAMFLLAVSSARRSIYLTTPYFVPDGQLTDALARARERGVRVVLLLPGATDSELVRQAGRAGFGRLLEAGVEIYEYQAGLLHAKTMSVDGVWATVGSANLDRRSLGLNDEVNLVAYDRAVATRLERIFFEDLAHARRVEETRWRSRGAWDRLVEFLSAPLRGQL